MGRAIVNKQDKAVDISQSARQTQINFSEQTADVTVGPQNTTSGSGGDVISSTNPVLSQINRWQVMTIGDDGLRAALYDWINTTKEGIKVAPNILSGRTKKLTFNFYGNIGKCIKPGEIGEFNLIFSYPPQTITSQINTNLQT